MDNDRRQDDVCNYKDPVQGTPMIRAHRQQFLYESLNNGIVRCKLFEFSGLYIFECKEAKNYQTGSFVLYAMLRRRSSSSIIST